MSSNWKKTINTKKKLQKNSYLGDEVAGNRRIRKIRGCERERKISEDLGEGGAKENRAQRPQSRVQGCFGRGGEAGSVQSK